MPCLSPTSWLSLGHLLCTASFKHSLPATQLCALTQPPDSRNLPSLESWGLSKGTVGSPVDSIKNKALMQSSPPIPSLKITLSPNQLGVASAGEGQSSTSSCCAHQAVPGSSVKGFSSSLGIRSHVQPDTCLHCCPMAPSLLLHSCLECALLCMLCLPLFPHHLPCCKVAQLLWWVPFPWERKEEEGCFAQPEALWRRAAWPLFASQAAFPGDSSSSGTQRAHCRGMNPKKME